MRHHQRGIRSVTSAQRYRGLDKHRTIAGHCPLRHNTASFRSAEYAFTSPLNLAPIDLLKSDDATSILTPVDKQSTSIDDQVEAFIDHLNGLSSREALQTSGVRSHNF